jgi:hypothetical protein
VAEWIGHFGRPFVILPYVHRPVVAQSHHDYAIMMTKYGIRAFDMFTLPRFEGDERGALVKKLPEILLSIVKDRTAIIRNCEEIALLVFDKVILVDGIPGHE